MVVITGLDPVTQPTRVRAAKRLGEHLQAEIRSVAWTRDALGGRVALRLPGHDETFMRLKLEANSSGLRGP